VTIHRYDGTVTHTFGLKSWLCTCGANGATQCATVDLAKQDYPLHQRAAAIESCPWCDATTDELFSVDGALWLCEDCYREALPKAELMEDK
jgi:hypothetical protein